MQAVPSLTCEVRCEIADSSEIGSQRGFEKRLSPTQTESKPELLDDRREVEQHLEVVVRGDQRLPVVQVDAELRAAARQLALRTTTSSSDAASRRRCGMRMCSPRSRTALSTSPRAHGAQDRLVLDGRAPQRAAQRDGAHLVAAHLAEQPAHRLLQHRVARRLDEGGVEARRSRGRTHRRPQPSASTTISSTSACSRASSSAPSRGHGELDREHLQRLAQLVGREELLRRERGDDGAAARAHGHETLGGETPDRLAHRSPGDAERLRERDLVELAARRQAVVEDLLAQVLVHALPQRQVLDPASTGGVDALLALVGRHCNHFPHRV